MNFASRHDVQGGTFWSPSWTRAMGTGGMMGKCVRGGWTAAPPALAAATGAGACSCSLLLLALMSKISEVYSKLGWTRGKKKRDESRDESRKRASRPVYCAKKRQEKKTLRKMRPTLLIWWWMTMRLSTTLIMKRPLTSNSKTSVFLHCVLRKEGQRIEILRLLLASAHQPTRMTAAELTHQ